RAGRRMAPKRDAKPAIAALQRFVTPAEYVLETALVTAQAPAPKATGLLAVTTTRLIFVALGSGKRFAHELPIATLLWARTTDDADAADSAPGEYGFEVSDGNLIWNFVGSDRADTDRVAGALNFAIQREVADGAAGPADPGVAKLYSEWELLVERHSLGMVDDAQFQRYGRGILRSLPD
ncbi:hypothetical protein ACWELJ_22030, partial [Nocardia sp. NPDC004582]